jgi:5'-3' exonuclease
MKQSDDEEMENMRRQFSRLSMYLQTLPISVLSVDNIEADDVIGYIATEIYKDSDIIISSTDKDFLHLINDRVKVWQPVKKQLFDKEAVFDMFNVPANNLVVLRAFEGDGSDNIKGVNGVGRKGLLKNIPILSEHTSITVNDVIDYAQTQIDNGNKYAIFQKIVDGKEIVNRNAILMDLRENRIAGQTKLKIQRLVEEKIPAFNRIDFKKMFMTDKMFNAIPNLDNWLMTTFNVLETFSRK